MERPTNPDHEGYLYKKGQVRWNMRYFALRGRVLRYWDTEEIAKHNGFKEDPRNGSITIQFAEKLAGDDKAKQFFFNIHGTERGITVYTDNEDNRDIWLGKIHAMLHVEAENEAAQGVALPNPTMSVVSFADPSVSLVLNRELVVMEAHGEAFDIGVRVGDRVVAVNQTVCTGKSRDGVMELLQTVHRPYTVTLHRKYVTREESVGGEMLSAFQFEERHSQLAKELKQKSERLDEEHTQRKQALEQESNRLKCQQRSLERALDELEKEKKEMMKENAPSDILALSLGGERKVLVPRATLCLYPYTKLAWLYNGRHDDKFARLDDGSVLVDLPPDLFSTLVDHLRLQRAVGMDTKLPPPKVPSHRAEHWQAMLRHLGVADAVLGALASVSLVTCMVRGWDEVSNGMYGFMFDVCNATQGDTVLVHGLRACGCSASLATVYACEGSHVEHKSTPANWKVVGTGAISEKAPSPLQFSSPFAIKPNTSMGVYIATNHICGVAFVNGNERAGEVTASDGNVEVRVGHYLSSASHFEFYTESKGWHWEGVLEYSLQEGDDDFAIGRDSGSEGGAL